MGGIAGCCELADALARLLCVTYTSSLLCDSMILSFPEVGGDPQNFSAPGKYFIFIALTKMIKTDVEDGCFTCHWHSINVNTCADSENRFFWKTEELQGDVRRGNLKAASVLLPPADFPKYVTL